MSDLISRQAAIDATWFEPSYTDPLNVLTEVRDRLKALPSVTPTHTETVTEFADRCRECGKTAITRAENDEILNEAWHLLMNATEEDGISTGELNGMLKLMAFFLYKYHGQKKPEWVENVEARIEESEDKE